jgi:heat shock protein HspQ
MGTVTPIRNSAFAIGDVISHRKFGYRGVIFDIDATFQLTDDWYENVARSRPPKDQPWYHVLVDGGSHTTYVAERHLEQDDSGRPVSHPLVDVLFSEFAAGRYRQRRSTQ